MTAPPVRIAADQIVRLKQLWSAGLSALEAGTEIGLVGDPSQIRDAVLCAIADANRLVKKVPVPKVARQSQTRSNLPPRHRTPAKSAKSDDPDAPALPSDGFDGTPSEWDLKIPVEQRRSLLGPPHSEYPARGSKECGWPIGHPRDAGFFYCGAETSEHYCTFHRRVACGGYGQKRVA